MRGLPLHRVGDLPDIGGDPSPGQSVPAAKKEDVGEVLWFGADQLHRGECRRWWRENGEPAPATSLHGDGDDAWMNQLQVGPVGFSSGIEIQPCVGTRGGQCGAVRVRARQPNIQIETRATFQAGFDHRPCADQFEGRRRVLALVVAADSGELLLPLAAIQTGACGRQGVSERR